MKKMAFLLAYLVIQAGVSSPAEADSHHIAQEIQLEHVKKQLEELRTVTMRVTAYYPPHPKKAVLGRAKAGRDCAVSRDLAYMLGRIVNVPQVGLRKVTDLMAEGKVNSLDLVMGSRKAAKHWGVKHKKVSIVKG